MNELRNCQKEVITIFTIPEDIIVQILRRLDLRGLISLLITSKLTRSIINETLAWNILMEKDYRKDNNKLLNSKRRHRQLFINMSVNERYKLIHLTKKLSEKILHIYAPHNTCLRNDEILKLLSKEILELYCEEIMPSGIRYLTNLKKLRICNMSLFNPTDKRKLSTINEGISNLKNLHILELCDHVIETIPNAVYELKNLEQLELNDNKIKYISDHISNFTNLKRLELENNQLEEIPNELYKLTSLERINLEGNNISYLSKDISRLQNLSYLRLSKNKFSYLPDTLRQLTKLKTLDVCVNNFNGVIDFPTSTNLVDLCMIDTGIVLLPESISLLVNLNSLELSNNKIKEFPREICSFTKLEILDIRNNFITYIPDDIGKLTKLYSLDLAKNKICNIPNSLFKINDCMDWIDFNNNCITELSSEISELVIIDGIDKLTIFISADELKYNDPNRSLRFDNKGNSLVVNGINLSENQITSIPFTVTYPLKLKTLYIVNNPIEHISENIVQNKHITIL